MSSNGKNKSFWSTVPGILTGIAAIITAITGLVIGLSASGIVTFSSYQPQATPTPTPTLTPTPTPTLTPTPTPTATVFSAPELISPSDGTVFSHYPRTTELNWASVSGAVSYTVQVEYRWDSTWSSLYNRVVYTNTFKFEFVGAQPGRWRVCAVRADGEERWSDWWGFSYTI